MMTCALLRYSRFPYNQLRFVRTPTRNSYFFVRELASMQPKLVRYVVRENVRTLREREAEFFQLHSNLRSSLDSGQPRQLVCGSVGVILEGELLEFRAGFEG